MNSQFDLSTVTFSDLIPWMKDGGLVLLMAIILLKDRFKRAERAERVREAEERTEQDKIKQGIRDLERAHEVFTSRSIEIEASQGHLRQAIDTLSLEVKALTATINDMLIVKAKEITELGVKIQEHERRIGKLEDSSKNSYQ